MEGHLTLPFYPVRRSINRHLQSHFDAPFTSVDAPRKTPNFKNLSNKSSERFSLYYPNLSSSFLYKSSVEGFLNWELTNSETNNTLTSSSQRVIHSYNLRSTPIQSAPSSRKRSVSGFVFAILRYHAQSLHVSVKIFFLFSLSLSLSLSLKFHY